MLSSRGSVAQSCVVIQVSAVVVDLLEVLGNDGVEFASPELYETLEIDVLFRASPNIQYRIQ